MVGGTAVPPGFRLEVKLQCKLYKPRIANLRDLSKLGTIRSISIRVEELCVIEDVEELSPEVNVHCFGYRDRLQDGKITLAEVRPAADRTLSVSECPQQRGVIAPENGARRAGGSAVISGILRETIGVEVIVSVRLRLQGTERCNLRRLAWQFEIKAIHQLVIGQRRDLDGESRLKSSDARDGPPVQQLAGCPAVFAERQFPVIAKDDSVTSVKRRQRTASTCINWI